MADPTGESKSAALRLDFERRLMLQFRGSVITSDGGLLAYRELDDAVGLTGTVADVLADARTGKNSRDLLVGLLRQSVFGIGRANQALKLAPLLRCQYDRGRFGDAARAP
jgi:hypothetical protein